MTGKAGHPLARERSGSGSGSGGGTGETPLMGIAPAGEHVTQSWTLFRTGRVVSSIYTCVG